MADDRTVTVRIDVSAIDVESIKRHFEQCQSQIAGLIRQGVARRPISKGQAVWDGDVLQIPIKPPLIERPKFRVGVGQIDDVGYAFRFADDKHSPPYILSKERTVEAGAEWMRLNAPRQWAAFCAARILGKQDVQIVPEERMFW